MLMTKKKMKTHRCACFVGKRLFKMSIEKLKSFALINADTIGTILIKVAKMDKEYLTIMSIIKSLKESGLIKEDEYLKINKEMVEKYKPILSILVLL